MKPIGKATTFKKRLAAAICSKVLDLIVPDRHGLTAVSAGRLTDDEIRRLGVEKNLKTFTPKKLVATIAFWGSVFIFSYYMMVITSTEGVYLINPAWFGDAIPQNYSVLFGQVANMIAWVFLNRISFKWLIGGFNREMNRHQKQSVEISDSVVENKKIE